MSVVLDIALPCVFLMLIAGVAPYVFSRLLGEGVRPLLMNALLCVFCCIVAAAVMRVVVGADGASPLQWVGLTAIVWLPVLLLALAQQPKRWKEVEW